MLAFLKARGKIDTNIYNTLLNLSIKTKLVFINNDKEWINEETSIVFCGSFMIVLFNVRTIIHKGFFYFIFIYFFRGGGGLIFYAVCMKYINNSYIKFINSNFQFIVLFVQILTSWKSKRSYVCCVWPYSNSIYISNLVSDAWSQKFCLYFNSRRPYKSMDKFIKDTISLGCSCPKVYHVPYFMNNLESAIVLRY